MYKSISKFENTEKYAESNDLWRGASDFTRITTAQENYQVKKKAKRRSSRKKSTSKLNDPFESYLHAND